MRSFSIVSLCGGPSAAAGGTLAGGSAGGFQPPKRASTSRRASSTVMAPTTVMMVVSGRTFAPWKRATSSRVSLPTDSIVPSTGLPYGWFGKTRRASARFPTVPGSSSERLMAAWICATFRFTSSGGKVGVSSTSANRSSPSARSFLSTASEALRPSRPAPAERLPPTNSIALSSSGPVCLAVPRVSSVPVRFASPARSGGSRTAPAWANVRTTMMGTAGRSATRSTMPLGSTSRCAMGLAAPAGSASSTASTTNPIDRRRRRMS